MRSWPSFREETIGWGSVAPRHAQKDIPSVGIYKVLTLRMLVLTCFRAMQSDTFTIIVGSAQSSFKVPQDLLIQISSFFEKACKSRFRESAERTIRLPEEKESVFGHFYVWLHGPGPRILPDYDIETFIDLAIFAEKYQILLLKNQTSDTMRWAIKETEWQITPELLSTVYHETPANSVLRRLALNGFGLCYKDEKRHVWKQVFDEHTELGWDYFDLNLKFKPRSAELIMDGGACRFHDHSDVPGWIFEPLADCPDLESGLAMIPEKEKVVSAKKPEEDNSHAVEVVDEYENTARW